MTAVELIAFLQKVPPDTEVMVYDDRFGEYNVVDEATYVALMKEVRLDIR